MTSLVAAFRKMRIQGANGLLRFPEIGVPRFIIHSHRIFHDKPTILGTPIYGNPHIPSANCQLAQVADFALKSLPPFSLILGFVSETPNKKPNMFPVCSPIEIISRKMNNNRRNIIVLVELSHYILSIYPVYRNKTVLQTYT